VWASIYAIVILHPSFLSNYSSIPLLIIFPIHWPDDGFILYVVLTTVALSMWMFSVFICLCGCSSVYLMAQCMHLVSAYFSASNASACLPIPSSFLIIVCPLWYAMKLAPVHSSVLEPPVYMVSNICSFV
jgi:hypothetical protein